MSDVQTRDGKARLICAEVMTEQRRLSSSHVVTIGVQTLTREQADALKCAFLDWFTRLEFGQRG